MYIDLGFQKAEFCTVLLALVKMLFVYYGNFSLLKP